LHVSFHVFFHAVFHGSFSRNSCREGQRKNNRKLEAGGRLVFSRILRVGALFLGFLPGIAHGQGQDSPRLARALERAERFDSALGPKPQPTAKWLAGDRLAYSPTGNAPWAVLEAATGRALEPEVADAAVGGPGPAMGLPLGLSYFVAAASGPASPLWMTQPANNDLVVSDNAGATRLRLTGAQNYGWAMAPNAWNRDRRLFIALRVDNRELHRVPIVDYNSPIERVTYAPYPKTGTPLAVTELHVVDPAAAVARPVDLDTRDASTWFLGWRPTVAEAIVMRLSRTGKRLDLFAIDGATGATRLLARDERPATFVGALDFTTADWAWQVIPLPDDHGFLWMSERDGWRHVYLYGYDGALKRKVTSGAFPVHRVVHVDWPRRQISVVASGDSLRPYDRHVYRVGLDGTGFTALTSAPGQHDPAFSSSGSFFVDTYSSLTQPHTVELRRADGALVKSLGQASTAALAAAGYTPPVPFRVKASDGTTDLYGVLYRPADFDSTKRYPIVDYIYAGPFLAVHQTTYTPSGVAGAMHRIAASLAQMGFVVAMLDARGTPGRGKTFQDANYGRIGQIEIPDHVAALRALARSRPFMDTTRAGIVGHSWGGYFALRGMLTAPDFFKVGYAGAPGDLTEAASINEPNMGLLETNQAGYAAGSNPARASALTGKLKIMHGTSDVMAPFSTTMRVTKALIDANKTFDLLVMPGQPHGPQGAAGRYYREDVRRYMATHLLGDDAGTTGRIVPE
jgi:dipeptidyl aminopeptidase/acylaminoacyl peptidase